VTLPASTLEALVGALQRRVADLERRNLELSGALAADREAQARRAAGSAGLPGTPAPKLEPHVSASRAAVLLGLNVRALLDKFGSMLAA